MKKTLSHVDACGKANMVDVGGKPIQVREARATGHITLLPSTLGLISTNGMPKGDVLTVAQIAGIQGGKRTSELIPLCHPLAITKLDVAAVPDASGIRIDSLARCTGQTGIEMEALTAVSIALLTIYDMCKAVDPSMVIDEVRLIEKTKQNLQ
ncbi:MAG TPA: cyclic pyranopterin monophosphate synthase MoaC [Bacteroidales bacterium]|nr:cyclic pyranopterin monophosphate synthase MoaC [Bacteroidales bacterium]HPS63645.1 cyclic pyranopterin monophosphate synthase MoaC [Bacteroidales bacterium]